jgi:ubiquinone/menaquinone biosynthesis C-methylase UbiE
MFKDTVTRFSNRAENYSKYRPEYPAAVLALLKKRCEFTREFVVADVGSGTGILSELFLKSGNLVYGIEPNKEMRDAAEHLLRAYPRFHSLNGAAEAVPLEDQSVHLVAAGQAFHWFDPKRARAEFSRILKPGGWMVITWNERQKASSPFLKEYEELLIRYGTDYKEVSQAYPKPAALKAFFAPSEMQTAQFENTQTFDLEGTRGRLLSASYAPDETHPNHKPMMEKLARIFERHQTAGRILFEYKTHICFGKLS